MRWHGCRRSGWRHGHWGAGPPGPGQPAPSEEPIQQAPRDEDEGDDDSEGEAALAALLSPADVLRFVHAELDLARPPVVVPAAAVSMTGELGGGQFGVVCACSYLGIPHAVKRICIENLTVAGMPHSAVARMLIGEVSAMMRLRHPRLVQLSGVCLVPAGTAVQLPYVGTQPLDMNEVWLLMPLAEGGSLAASVASLRSRPACVLRLLCDVAEAVAFMHGNGCAHLDLKPTNVLLDDAREPRRALVADLGLAQSTQGTTLLPSAARGWGTLGYAPPEQMDMQTPVDLRRRADVFAFGVMALEVLTGTGPIAIHSAARQGDLAAVVSRLPPVAQPVQALLVQCVQVAPGDRPAMLDVYRTLTALDIEENSV
jgi:serine/threonine protein kinase